MPSASRTIARTTARNLLCGAFLVAGYFGVNATAGDLYAIPAPEVSKVAEVPSQVQRLIDANGCWTGDAPADMAGVIPGHVVVTVDGVTRLGGSKAVGAALEQVFEGVDHGLTVHAFCRGSN